MEYRQLGKSGLQVSVLALGTWTTIGERLDLNASKAVLDCAFEQGINFFDTADVYNNGQSERVLGELLNYFNWPREAYVISSKVFFGLGANPKPNTYGLSRKHIIEACHASLKRLNLEYLDLYFCHRPDPNTPLLETVHAMSGLIHQGKILYWGTSEWTAAQLLEVYQLTENNSFLIPPISEQSQYNLFARERVENELTPLYESHGLGITVWSPLRSGLLAGRYNNGVHPGSRLAAKGNEASRREVMGHNEDERIFLVNQLTDYVQQELNISLAELALAWCLRNKSVSSAIIGASTASQIIDNCKGISFAETMNTGIMRKLDDIMLNNVYAT
ncbi:aldo/keto reductase [Legionella quinlivanii]|uniref:aldo/keto reductase n=1 Tax=Legionella quinlivanii TaxID=45073 RepID=UPI002243F33B|nr:aldo/keto reductase [Legionella quinlivanii]MCW8449765.1 aldo/keto reductase [Legionella quinlivanii]